LLVTSQLLGPPLLLALQLSTAPIQLHAFRFRDGSGQPKLSLGAKVVGCSLVLSPLRLLGVSPSGLRLVVEVWSMLASELGGGRPKERVRGPGRLLACACQPNGAHAEQG
jgi:hypothetical protein